MIWAFLTSKALGLAKGWWLLIAIAAIITAIIAAGLWLSAREQADDRRNQDIGATMERERSTTATIKQVEKANAAAETVVRDADAGRAECLRNARNPADC